MPTVNMDNQTLIHLICTNTSITTMSLDGLDPEEVLTLLEMASSTGMDKEGVERAVNVLIDSFRKKVQHQKNAGEWFGKFLVALSKAHPDLECFLRIPAHRAKEAEASRATRTGSH